MSKFIRILCVIFFIFSTNTKSVAAIQQSGGWWGTFSNHKLSNDNSFWVETQLRYNVSHGQLGQILYRTGLLQKMGDSMGLGYLYGFIQTPGAREHRLALQHTMKYSSTLSHRIRVEYRDLEDNDDLGYRFRYLFRYQGKKLFDHEFVFWNELFLNLNKTSWNGNRSMDRNRLFFGLRKKLGHLNLEYGYLNQYVPRDKKIYEHLFVLYLFF